MELVYESCAVTHIGNRRKRNEDNFYIGSLLFPQEQRSMSQIENSSLSKKSIADGKANRVFAVSDGMGSHKHGEVASYMVSYAIDKFVIEHNERTSRKRKEKYAYIQSFQDMIAHTNDAILEYASDNEAKDNMGATLSGLVFFSDEAVAINIGDSSTFRFENSALCKLTVDDNESSRFEGANALKLPANGKRLTKYFGLPKSSGMLTAAISAPFSLKPGQIFLIASDGLTDSMSSNAISGVLKDSLCDMEDAANKLVDKALGSVNGGRDNITVVLIKVRKAIM